MKFFSYNLCYIPSRKKTFMSLKTYPLQYLLNAPIELLENLEKMGIYGHPKRPTAGCYITIKYRQ